MVSSGNLAGAPAVRNFVCPFKSQRVKPILKSMKYPTLLLCLCCGLMSSCGAYFNTYHNTKKLYKEATKEREKRKGDKITPTEKQKYEETIKKASKILELYPNSKYVDDALFILGECLYYKSEFIPAQRKFQELITYFPNGGYHQRARMWLARTNIKLRDYATARVILNALLEQEDLDTVIRQESRYLLGDIHFIEKDYAAAEKEYVASAGVGEDRKIREKALFRAGECQLLLGENDKATKSFLGAIKYSNDKNGEFEARLHYARALKQGGDFKGAARECNLLEENQDYRDKIGQVQLEIADIVYMEGKALFKSLQDADLQFKGKIKEALDKYEIVLLQNKRTEVAAAAHYRIGRIKEEDLHDFAGALESYQKVKLEYSRSPYAAEAEQRAKDIADLIRLSNEVRKAQGGQLLASGAGSVHELSDLELLLLEYGVDPELRFMRERQKLEAASAGVDSTANASKIKQDEEKKRHDLVASKLQLAEVYYFQFGQVDSALAEYSEISTLFGEDPAAAKALYSSAHIYEQDYHNKFKSDSLLYEVIQRFPDSEQARAAQKQLALKSDDHADPAEAIFDRAGDALFSDRNIPEALRLYRSIVDAYPESDFAPLALYAIGWVEEQMVHNNVQAAEVYRTVVEKYPDFRGKAVLERKLASFDKGLHAQAEEQPEAGKASEADGTQNTSLDSLAEEGAETDHEHAPIVTRDRRPKTLARLRRTRRIRPDK